MKNNNIESINNSTVLVVEDNLIAQEIARYLLAANGFSIDVTDSGIEAIRLVEMHDYAFIILDFALPDMNGADIACAIRAHENTHNKLHSPIIILSSSVDQAEREACLAGGVNEVFPKPLTMEIIKRLKTF